MRARRRAVWGLLVVATLLAWRLLAAQAASPPAPELFAARTIRDHVSAASEPPPAFEDAVPAAPDEHDEPEEPLQAVPEGLWEEASCSLASNAQMRRAASVTTELTRDCEIVVYTTLFMPSIDRASKNLPQYGPKDRNIRHRCRVILAGKESAVSLRALSGMAGWSLVDTEVSYSTFESILPKLVPHLFFSKARYAVYLDYKLNLLAPLRDVVDLGLKRSGHTFVTMSHPCSSGGPPGTALATDRAAELCRSQTVVAAAEWANKELDILQDRATRGRWQNALAAIGAIRPRLAGLQRFPDTALVLRDMFDPVARQLSCAWAAEARAAQSTQLDQPELALVLADHLSSERVHLVEQCEPFCHWDIDRAKKLVATKGGQRFLGKDEETRPKRKYTAREMYGEGIKVSEKWRNFMVKDGDRACQGHPNMQRALLAITTCNHWDVTERLLEGLRANGEEEFYEPVLFDDASGDETLRRAEELGVRVVSNAHPEGVTYTWNVAYRVFKHECWGYYFNVNNDIVVPRGAIPNMIGELKAHPEIGLLGPMTTVPGIGMYSILVCPKQPVDAQFPFEELEPLLQQLPQSVQSIQDYVAAKDEDVVEARVLGFFVAGSRSMLKVEISPDHFWDPLRVNLGQEMGFLAASQGKMYVSRRAFVYHEKGTTIKAATRDAGKAHKTALLAAQALAASVTEEGGGGS